jgi:hypothetical protein
VRIILYKELILDNHIELFSAENREQQAHQTGRQALCKKVCHHGACLVQKET